MVKLTGALFFLVDASSPWGLRVPSASAFAPIILPRARHIVSYHIVTKGSGWADVPGVAPVRFTAGDVLVFPHGDPYAMLSEPDGQPALGGEESLDFFRAMAAGQLPFVVPEGGGTGEEAWRAYSITGDPSQSHAYEIAVLRVGDHGVSAWLHDHVQVGDVLTIAPPRNDFLLADDAAEHVLLAGGIGLTPLLAMARWLERWGARYRLVVSAKMPGRLAFRDALSRLDTGPVRLHFTGTEGQLDLAAEIGAPGPGRHLYVCGPNTMVQDARRVARELGWLESAVHVELFNAVAVAGDVEFEVGLSRSGMKFAVPPGRTILELMLEQATTASAANAAPA